MAEKTLTHEPMLTRGRMMRHRAFSRALASSSRLVILAALARGERTATELREMLGASAPLISWHLRVLKRESLLTTHRRGREVVCNLDEPELLRKQRSLFEEILGSDKPGLDGESS